MIIALVVMVASCLMRITLTLLVGMVATQQMVGPGAMVPSGGGGGGGPRFGGYVRLNEPVLGFFIGGSSIEDVNGVYGPRITSGLPAEIQQDLGHGAYRHHRANWLLAHVRNSGGGWEWVLFDVANRERFHEPSDQLIPRAGSPSWQHLHRASRAPPPDAGPAEGGATGAASQSSALRPIDEDDLDELPWQVIGLRDHSRLEELRRSAANREAAQKAADERQQARLAPPASAPPSASGVMSARPPTDVEGIEAAAASDSVAASEVAAAVVASERGDHTEAAGRLFAASDRLTGWAAAVVQLKAASLLRHGGEFSAATAQLQATLRAFPRFAAAHFEAGCVSLDAREPRTALASFEHLLQIDPDWPSLTSWLVRAHAAEKRSEAFRKAEAARAARLRQDARAARMARENEPPPPEGCALVQVGPQPPAGPGEAPTGKVVDLQGSLEGSGGWVCPSVVDRSNWLDGHLHADAFSVEQAGGRLLVNRSDLNAEAARGGWGLDLRFFCCTPDAATGAGAASGEAVAAAALEASALAVKTFVAAAAEAEAEAEKRDREDAPWRQTDHYAVLGVPHDFDGAELKKQYRGLSLRLHPDRAGGSTVAFARIAAAHDCLSEPDCRHAFDDGADIEGFSPSFREAVEKHYWPERYPFEPFGDPFEHHPDAARKERAAARRRAAASSHENGRLPTAGPEVSKDEL